MTSAKVKVLMDCDPGHDDAFALIVASKFADVLGVTTVAGNAPLSLTTKNARIILDLCGSNAPLHSGASRPLVAEPIHAAYIHGESGMDGAKFPDPSRPADGTKAVFFIIDTVRANPGVWLVPTGPLTNIALALRAESQLWVVAGSVIGRRLPNSIFGATRKRRRRFLIRVRKL